MQWKQDFSDLFCYLDLRVHGNHLLATIYFAGKLKKIKYNDRQHPESTK